jgi:hypothetical protein
MRMHVTRRNGMRRSLMVSLPELRDPLQASPSRHRRPASWGADRRRRPPCQDGLDARQPGWRAPAGVCSACPGRTVSGARPSRSRSAPAGGAVTATTYSARRALRPDAAARPRRPGRAGRLPHHLLLHLPVATRRRGPWLSALHASRRALAWPPPPGFQAAAMTPWSAA